MPILRLAYTTQFLIALFTIFELWSQVGGQSHLDLMPWYLKLFLAAGAAFATVQATASAVSQPRAWNGGTLRWVGILLALLVGCGLASYYYHVYGEQQEPDDQDEPPSALEWSPSDVGRPFWAASSIPESRLRPGSAALALFRDSI